MPLPAPAATVRAWDLELLFRQAATKVRNERLPTPRSAASYAAMLVLALYAVPSAEAAIGAIEPDQARTLAAEVLAGEDVGTKREIRTWVYVGSPSGDRGEIGLPDWILDIIDATTQGAKLIPTLLKWILILLAFLVLGLVLYRILPELRRRKPHRPAAPLSDHALRLLKRQSADDLPMDVEANVAELIAAKDLRAALALLYRASLARLTQRHGLDVPASATELECLTLVAGARPADETEVLRQLTMAWRRLAYGHRPPGEDEVTVLLQDWRQWQGSPGEA